MDQKCKGSGAAALAIAAPLCGGALWAAALWVGFSRELAAAGAAVCLLGAILAALARSGHCKQLAEQEEARRRELDALKEAHALELAQVRENARHETESFRSGLSHSMRMPVAIIQGYAELLAGDVVTSPEVRQEYLEKIVQRSRDLAEIMSRYSAIKESIDRDRLSYEKLDLIQLIRRAASDIQTAAQEQGVSVQVVSAQESLTIHADAYLLNRVLFNLLENALKYMGRAGTVTIRVLKTGETVSVLVQDDGLGLPSDETARIFDLRFQGSNCVGGGGYGLYLVRQAVEAHGGTVSAQSAPGQGMGISITLPVQPGKKDSALN